MSTPGCKRIPNKNDKDLKSFRCVLRHIRYSRISLEQHLPTTQRVHSFVRMNETLLRFSTQLTLRSLHVDVSQLELTNSELQVGGYVRHRRYNLMGTHGIFLVNLESYPR